MSTYTHSPLVFVYIICLQENMLISGPAQFTTALFSRILFLAF